MSTLSDTPTPVPLDEYEALRRRLREVEDRLRDREQVVRALTDRLEVAAETLDRLHRSGQDRGRHVSGFPREVVEQQSALVADMQRSVEQWEDMLASAMLGNVEMQLGELREFLEHRFAELKAHSVQPAESEPVSVLEPEAEPEPPPAAEVEPEPEPIREESLNEPPSGEVLPPVDPPQAIDLRYATTSALQLHGQRLDEFVDYLTARLQQVAARPNNPGWDGPPAQIVQRLNEIDAELTNAIRLADYELALTREMLARKEARLSERERPV